MKVLVGAFNKKKALVGPSLGSVKLREASLTALISNIIRAERAGGAGAGRRGDVARRGRLDPRHRLLRLGQHRLRGDADG